MNDVSRLQDEYADRARRLSGSDIYSVSNPINLFFIQGRQRAVLKALRKNGFSDLSNKRILEMGCGAGGVLTEFIFFGALPENLFGIDLLIDRMKQAHRILPGVRFANADGSCLPFPSGTFDLVIQYTAISSVLDPEWRRLIFSDMLRVTRPGGLILSYDFWVNPTNLQTRGLIPSELRKAFAGCSIEYNRITLAPPLARRLVPLSWGVSHFLEKLRVFNTHYLAIIQPLVEYTSSE